MTHCVSSTADFCISATTAALNEIASFLAMTIISCWVNFITATVCFDGRRGLEEVYLTLDQSVYLQHQLGFYPILL